MEHRSFRRWINGILGLIILFTICPAEAYAQETGVGPETMEWPGENTVTGWDTEQVFAGNASGLDFYNRQLYAVDNGRGILWILEAFPGGGLRLAPGYETGKKLQYLSRDSAKGPDAEGVTVCDKGYVYVAAERDNGSMGINHQAVLQVDPRMEGDTLQALQEWDLTESLPYTYLNRGVESIEWVPGTDMTGKLADQNMGKPFDIRDYPQAVSGGVFFLGLEMNDHIYAYILNEDGSAVQIAELIPGLVGISALDYDTEENILWAAADDRGQNKMAKIQFLAGEMHVTIVLPPKGVNPSHNNEGFAIAQADMTQQDLRPVYRLRDGPATEALSIGFLHYHYHRFSEEWVQSESAHWHECECGERQGEQTHSLVNLVTEAAEREPLTWEHTAVYYQSCGTCGYIDQDHIFYDGMAMDPQHLTTPVAAQIYGIPSM